MRFQVVANFSEAVDPELRQARLRKVHVFYLRQGNKALRAFPSSPKQKELRARMDKARNILVKRKFKGSGRVPFNAG